MVLHAVCVCVRFNGTRDEAADWNKLMTSTTDDPWYVENPLDLSHNLAGKWVGPQSYWRDCNTNNKRYGFRGSVSDVHGGLTTKAQRGISSSSTD